MYLLSKISILHLKFVLPVRTQRTYEALLWHEIEQISSQIKNLKKVSSDLFQVHDAVSEITSIQQDGSLAKDNKSSIKFIEHDIKLLAEQFESQ